jgi:hypothetical protein
MKASKTSRNNIHHSAFPILDLQVPDPWMWPFPCIFVRTPVSLCLFRVKTDFALECGDCIVRLKLEMDLNSTMFGFEPSPYIFPEVLYADTQENTPALRLHNFDVGYSFAIFYERIVYVCFYP